MKFDKRTRTYNIWVNMRQRCNNSNCPAYKYYGQRGIRICDEWSTYSKFIEDMGECSNHKLTLDRIDNNGNYCKENCRWADKITQANNTRVNKEFQIAEELNRNRPGKWRVRQHVPGVGRKHLGYFKTENLAKEYISKKVL